MLLEPTSTLREVTALHQLLAQPAATAGKTLTPAVSSGTARASDLPDAAGASRLLRGADMALYRVKTGENPDRTAVRQKLHGRFTKLVRFGVFVRVTDGIEGLVHLRELTSTPVESPSDVVQAGDEVTVVVTEIDRERRRLVLSRRPRSSDRR